MTDFAITLCACIAMIVGSARLGYLYAEAKKYEEINEIFRRWNTQGLAVEKKLNYLRSELTKYHRPRLLNGRFASKDVNQVEV